MADLVTAAELKTHLRRTTFDMEAGSSACRMASGWLRSATGLAEWPDPAPDDLWGWALELAALSYDNPTGLERTTLGKFTQSWGPEAVARRRQILEAARDTYNAGGGSAGPLGSFPCPEPYPDPARVWPWWVST